MLLSIILTLKPHKESLCPVLTGRQAQAWFLTQIEQHDPGLSESLHTSSRLRPYTVSGLMRPPWQMVRERETLSPDEPVMLRLTTLTPELSACWLNQILPALSQPLRLKGLTLACVDWTCAPAEYPWAGMASFSTLAQQAKEAHSRRVALEFATPTAFRSQGHDIPLPIPARLLRSWWQRWNAFAPPALQIDRLWPQFAEACVQVGRLSALRTLQWQFAAGRRGGATGFVGDVSLVLVSEKQSDTWASLWPGSRQILQTLGAFALYCGSGHHTTVGMGQTRALPPKS